MRFSVARSTTRATTSSRGAKTTRAGSGERDEATTRGGGERFIIIFPRFSMRQANTVVSSQPSRASTGSNGTRPRNSAAAVAARPHREAPRTASSGNDANRSAAAAGTNVAPAPVRTAPEAVARAARRTADTGAEARRAAPDTHRTPAESPPPAARNTRAAVGAATAAADTASARSRRTGPRRLRRPAAEPVRRWSQMAFSAAPPLHRVAPHMESPFPDAPRLQTQPTSGLQPSPQPALPRPLLWASPPRAGSAAFYRARLARKSGPGGHPAGSGSRGRDPPVTRFSAPGLGGPKLRGPARVP